MESAPVMILFAILITVNYFTAEVAPLLAPPGEAGASRSALAWFHLPLALLFAAWLATALTDPGSAMDASWQVQAQAAKVRGETVVHCHKSGQWKPPRSHFDSVTKRLTLNMDHFCPWVLNTVGFYNRKFFLLFIIYTDASLCYAVALMALQLRALPDNDSTAHRRMGLWLVLMLDGVLLSALIPFAVWHLHMASRNETTIEADRYPEYDVGTFANLKQVFGARVWTWPFPCYCFGPDGDGLRWPLDRERGRVDVVMV